MNKVLVIMLLAGLQLSLFAGSYQVVSPDGSIELEIYTEQSNLYYKLFKDGEVLITKSGLGLEASLFGISDFGEISKITESEGTDKYETYWGTSKQISEEYKQVRLNFIDGLAMEFRVYNCGIAWRYICDLHEKFVVKAELAEFFLDSESLVYFPEAEGFSTPFEANYIPHKVGMLQDELFGTSPLLVKTIAGTTMVISEVNLENYPAIFMKFSRDGLYGTFPHYPKIEKEQILGRLRFTNIPQLSKKLVKKEENYISQCDGKQEFPWRAILVESDEIDLLSNQLIAALAEKPGELEDYSWVTPGKVVWDWYHNWNLQGVDFKAGINTSTYKYMVDFASENNLQYVNIDDGWSKLHDFRKINRNLNLEEVLAYAHRKNIGIFLWCTWQILEKNLDENLDYFEHLGVSGLKVDFFDRGDQLVVDFVNHLARECGKRKLLLNLHGIYKPTGLQITYPNLVNFEGILGLEYNKFSDKCTPVHNATVAFTRNVVGPMDYTPGGMKYVGEEVFKKSWSDPHVMTTKTQQMAMYVIFHGGVQMLADSPSLYEKDIDALSYLSKVPVSWDETVPIEGKIGEYVIVARRSGDDWYLAGLNSGKGMEFTIKTDFLPAGEYNVELLSDGNSASELISTEQIIKENHILEIKTIEAGGFVARFSPV